MLVPRLFNASNSNLKEFSAEKGLEFVIHLNNRVEEETSPRLSLTYTSSLIDCVSNFIFGAGIRVNNQRCVNVYLNGAACTLSSNKLFGVSIYSRKAGTLVLQGWSSSYTDDNCVRV